MTAVERAFKAGWHHGYYDGGEHDCRMVAPTAERAWEDFKRGQLTQVWDAHARRFVPCVPKAEPTPPGKE